jgi:hypothetical protein
MRLDSYRTRGSNGVNDVRTAGRWYLGGRSEANAGSTVDRPIPDPAPTRFPGRSSRRRRSSIVVSATSPSRTASHRKRVSGKPPPESRP